MSLLSRLFGGREKPTKRFAVLEGPGRYDLNVVGESHYQDVLEQVCGGRTEDSQRLKVQATLYLHDDNPHDPKAVAVFIENKLVGYLDREIARTFRKAMAADIGSDLGGAVVDAIIVGGWDRGGGNRGHFGVKLDLYPEWLE